MPRVELCVDIGNSFLKWGRVEAGQIASIASIPDSVVAWDDLATSWQLPSGECHWTIATVHPQRRDRFHDWLRKRGDFVLLLQSVSQLPMQVHVDFPAQVGIDRLLRGLGLRSLDPHSGAIVVAAGTAMTVDAFDESQSFLGGYIVPGRRLLAESLHQQTAQLPLIDEWEATDRVPGKNTTEAIRSGVIHLLLGGILRLDSLLCETLFPETKPMRVITGGDGAFLQARLSADWKFVPELTLEGIRLASRTAT
jgi:type III pantothenate kinase